ncbi:MAG: tyrosine-type recombinase/integrase [Vulcanimicrobiaceae bacterium]
MKATHGRAAGPRGHVPEDPRIADFAARIVLEDNHSPRTAQEYARDIEGFARFLAPDRPLAEASATVAVVDGAAIRRYVLELRERRRAKASSVRRKLFALRRYFAFERREGRRVDNPALDVKPPKAEERLPHVLAAPQVARLLRTRIAGRRDELRLRDVAILELLYASGIRRAELVGLDLAEVDLERRIARVIGKGNKERAVLFNAAARDAIRAYLAIRPRSADPALFLSARRRRLSHNQAGKTFRLYADLCGLDVRATPHTLRHSFATHLVQNGADLVTVKELLGHRSLATTQIYTNVSLEHMRRTYDEAHPRDAEAERGS